jgi:hypothetical protein
VAPARHPIDRQGHLRQATAAAETEEALRERGAAMDESARPRATIGRPALGGLRALVAVAALFALLLAVGFSPAFVERFLLSNRSTLDVRDLTCIAFVRAAYGVLGVTLLALAAAWSRLFAPLPLAKTLLFFAPIAVLAAIFGSKLAFFGSDPAFYRWLSQEDGVVEWATFAAYLGAGILALPVARAQRARHRPFLGALYALLAIALLFVALEEISWGQRLFGIETPDAFSSNAQEELNVHNLPSVQRYLHWAYVVVGLVGGMAWTLLPWVRRIRPLAWLEELTPPWTLAPYFLSVSVVYLFYQLAPSVRSPGGQEFFGCITWTDQEPAELLLALGILAFVIQKASPGPGQSIIATASISTRKTGAASAATTT